MSLIQSPERKFSKKMVAVAVDGQIIGYCPAFLATQIRLWLKEWRYEDAQLQCAAIITRTLDSSREAMRFAVNLDIDLPFRMSAEPLMGIEDCWCVSA